MKTPLFQVDAFTNRAFGGNPAAVCLLEKQADAKWMQAVAAEMNLSETAFVRPIENGFELRWFTPAVEVELCGHATLASANVLWEQGVVDSRETITFHSQSGPLLARRDGDFIWLDFPARPVTKCDAPPGLLSALDITKTLFIGNNNLDYLIEVESEEAVPKMHPDFSRLANCVSLRGVMVTSRCANPEFDFVSRFFAPGAGVDEDPVTGAAHCCLGPFWQERLGKDKLVALQASRRGGVVRVQPNGDRVQLGGHAVTVLRGELLY